MAGLRRLLRSVRERILPYPASTLSLVEMAIPSTLCYFGKIHFVTQEVQHCLGPLPQDQTTPTPVHSGNPFLSADLGFEVWISSRPSGPCPF